MNVYKQTAQKYITFLSPLQLSHSASPIYLRVLYQPLTCIL